MTSLPGLPGCNRLQARRGELQTPTDNDDRRRQTPESKTILPPYTMCRRASNKPLVYGYWILADRGYSHRSATAIVPVTILHPKLP